jgi:23S rRNA (uracil1939-C5)-methyltransferase
LKNQIFFPKWENLYLFGNQKRFTNIFAIAHKHYICRKKVGRKKKKQFYQNVRIEDIGSEGKAIARVGEMVVFTKMAAPGDIVDLQVIRKRKKYQEAIITKFHEFSEERIQPFCDHFGTCGGCKWQFLPYTSQLAFKQKQVEDQLKRIGGIDIPAVEPILGSVDSTFYRNKLEFTFSDKKWLTPKEIESGVEIQNLNALGFHVPGMFDKVINIEKCWLQPSPSNEIRNFIFGYAIENNLEFFNLKNQIGFLRTLIIRTSSVDEVMVILSFFREDEKQRTELLNALKNRFPEITSLMYVINPKGNDTIHDLSIDLFYGRDHIFEKMEDLKFKIGPKSFYQTNSGQTHKLYEVVRNFADLTEKETVYDLYTGTGTIANFVARNAKKVIGIEYVPEAIADAKKNSALNNISNTVFFAGDAKDVITEDFFMKYNRPEVVITDPPRAGMHAGVVKALLELKPTKIIYVSCNPATQARDLSLMNQLYKVTKIQPVDMFPHTHHVENVVLLEKRQKA